MRLTRILACGVSTLSLVAVGCGEEKTYCDGLNESNMPGAIVLVERMDSATRYVLGADDERVFLPDDLESLISCRDIDGLGRVSFPARIEIEDFDIRWGESINFSSDEYCIDVPFTGAMSAENVSFLDYYSFYLNAGVNYATGVNPIGLIAAVGTDMSSEWLDEDSLIRSAFVVSALSERTAEFSGSTSLRSERQIYYQDSDDEAPPLVIGRAYTFRRGYVPDGLAEYLGVPELQNEGFQCVDLFFGYYEEGE